MNLYLALILITLATLIAPTQIACAYSPCEILEEECEMICRMNDEKLLPDNYEEDLFLCFQLTRDIRCLKK